MLKTKNCQPVLTALATAIIVLVCFFATNGKAQEPQDEE